MTETRSTTLYQESRILIGFADDHTSFRKAIAQYINARANLEVIIEASNGKELIDQLRASKQLPDICIVDVSMPEMNGLETVSCLKKEWPEIGVLIISMHAEEWLIVNMIRNGAGGYLVKNCDPDEILEAVEWIYKQGVYFSGLMNKRLLQSVRDDRLRIPNLTAKEMIFLKNCCTDMTYEDIAIKMGHTIRSVYGFRDSLFRKLDVHSRVGLVLFAVRAGYVMT